ncbi:HK97 family phage portal protein [Rhodococcus sp. AG1013]|uniref:phage portal protein n=1 Tax=Rhodococcus sp. AG1013 TaxID=2183996 RepID=UPI000E0A550A|nr:phage portal protein [Rhodococcus sp. AG1013]RDI13458.1 HK97 family phage portal protein [Rhodococcus sp. AG1013]
MGLASFFGFGAKAPAGESPGSAPAVVVNLDGLRGQTVEKLWRDQPNLRTVVGFLARNVSQLGLHVFEASEDGNHARTREGALADLFRKPNPEQTCTELVYDLVATLALYDIAYWFVAPDAKSESGWIIRPIRPTWITDAKTDGAFAILHYEISLPEVSETLIIPAEDMLVFHGWNPEDTRIGSSPVSALKAILGEQISAQTYRKQRWDNGGRVDAFITRPASAPEWSPEAKEKWVKQYRDTYSGNSGRGAGGTPFLEDGMELKRLGFSSKEDEYIDSAKLALTTVASVYYVNPVMVGILDNANYSNVKEFSRMLYSDTLGPTLRMIQDRINTFLAPRIDPGRMVEFNVKEKMKGSFEEEAASLQAATGRPWMTADEARATQNMPALGGDAALLTSNLNQVADNPNAPTTVPDDGGEG